MEVVEVHGSRALYFKNWNYLVNIVHAGLLCDMYPKDFFSIPNGIFFDNEMHCYLTALLNSVT